MDTLETDWLQRALQGDDEAFTWMVERYQTPVYNLCYRMLGADPQAAEDAAQETFWRVYQNLKRYDSSRPFITWLLSIAAHYCIDQQRRNHIVALPIDDLLEETAPSTAPDPEHIASRNEEAAAIQSILKGLNPPDRAAVILRYWYDFSEEEIARALSLSVSAVKSRLHRTRLLLAQRWQDAHPDTGTLKRRQHESPAY